MSMRKHFETILCLLCAMAFAGADGAATGVVSFRDANKIKSWDAWNDHVKKPAITNILQKERRCVTWARLNRLNFGLVEIGRLSTRTSAEIRGSAWSVGCETMDRDYADWDSFKALVPMLGVKHARFFSGWAKTEQEKGVYDFTWLDPQIRECAAMRVKPWVCISYGNPVYGSDFRLGMRVKQVTDNPEAFEAWLRYTKALVTRYRDVVDEWEVWNEPFGQSREYAELFYRTAKAIREVQPAAKIFCTAISMNRDMTKSDYAVLLERLKRENALDLASYFIYHPYGGGNPDANYDVGGTGPLAMPLRRLVKSYSDRFDILQGEVGCPAQLEFAHALADIEWTEYSQAKWNLRRAIGDAVRSIPSSCFTMIDLQYTFMLQSFGLVRSNALKEFVYRRPSWYAMRNVYALIDDETQPKTVRPGIVPEITARADPRDAARRELTCALFARGGRSLRFYWYSNARPSNRLEFDRVTLHVPEALTDPVWVDMITGRVGAIDPQNARVAEGETTLTNVPMWDSPILIASRAAVPFAPAKKGRADGRDLVVYEGPAKAWSKEPLVFPGPWDLSSRGTISVEVENTSATDAVRLNVDFSGQSNSRCRMTMIPPGFKGTIDLDVCPPIAHPEVAAQMKLMRTDPFMGGDGDRKFNPSAVPAIRLEHYWTGASTAAKGAVPTVLVKRVVAKDTSSRKWPAWYAMDARTFFPFVDRYGQFRHDTWPGKVSSDADLRRAAADEAKELADVSGNAEWDEYGGWAKGPKRKATGRFRLEKIDGKWWFVDPIGNLWWSHGVVRVSPSSAVTPLDGRRNYFADLPKDDGTDPFGAFYHTNDELLKPYYDKRGWKETYDFSAANLFRKYGDGWRAAFGDLCHRRLRSWGLNTIANSSDRAIRLMNRTPWIERLETRGPECQEQKNRKGWKGWWHIPDPFHPEFRRYFRALLESHRAELTSPWCVGVFVDNEHNWRDIREETVREYFKVIREEIDRLDPNLLYFGCRFAGSTERVVRLCAEYADAVSYNPYRFRLDMLQLPKGVDRPILVGEFHFGSTSDTGLFNPSLTQVPDQRARAEAYVRYVTDALDHPNIVGTHWHQFSDQPVTGRFDGENFNVGFTDVCDRPYRELVEAARKIGATLYPHRWNASSAAAAGK